MEKATANSLRREAEEMGLAVGRKVTIYTETDERKGGEKKTGVICAIYKHIFQCEMSGGYKECFRFNELIGNETGRRVRLRGF